MPLNTPFFWWPARTPSDVSLMQSSRTPTRDWASEASDLAVFAMSCAVRVSVLVANFTSRLLLFWVIFDEISCVTPLLVA